MQAQSGAQSTMMIPLISKDEVIGVLTFNSATTDTYSEHYLILAEKVGFHIAGAVANAQLFHEFKLSQEAFHETQAILKAAMDNSQAGIAIADAPDGTLRYVNDAGLLIRGGDRETVVNGVGVDSYVASWQRLDFDGRPLNADEEPLARAIMFGEICSREFIIRRSINDDRIVMANASPIKNDAGEIVAAIVVFSDITDRKRLEEERIDMERQLLQTQKLQSLGILAGGIAHDFNNLLMAVLGNLELAMDEISPVSSARPYLENSEKASRRAADLTRQMLAYSGKGRFILNQMNLSELVQENIHIFRSSISASIDLILHLNHDIPPIMADVGQIQQVVMNLITNAAEAIGDNAGTINLTNGVQTCDDACLKLSRLHEKPAPGDFIYLEVTDTGCGMDEPTQKKIFDPFFTTKFTGRGLGMSALQGIILGHKGAIFVDSNMCSGTTIRVLFPVSDIVQDKKPSILPPQEAPLVLDTPSKLGVILVADDEEAMRTLCSDMVARMGYGSLTAADGEEAVKVFRDNADDIFCVILDLTMPKMDGYVTFQALKQLRPDVKVILSSGYNEQVITQRFTGLGLAGFIQKPYRRQQLQDELKRVIADSEQ